MEIQEKKHLSLAILRFRRRIDDELSLRREIVQDPSLKQYLPKSFDEERVKGAGRPTFPI